MLLALRDMVTKSFSSTMETFKQILADKDVACEQEMKHVKSP